MKVLCVFSSLFVKPQLFDDVESEDQWKDFYFFFIPLVGLYLFQVVFH